MDSPEQPPPVTAQSAVARVPRACGDTAVSRALVSEAALPPQELSVLSQFTAAVAFDTLTGPDTATTPLAGSAVGLRSATVVSEAASQPPPVPCTEQVDVAVLSRTPVTSPDAEPEVLLAPEPVHRALSQSARAPAVLDATSSRPAGWPWPPAAAARRSARDGSAALSPTCEAASIEQSPAAVLQLEDALVSRTGAGPPATAGVPVTLPVVSAAALPVQAAAPPQSTLDPAVLDAVASPSVSAACRTR
ncbi:hypothetical protein, partial [Pseudonocardia aurantiaca]